MLKGFESWAFSMTLTKHTIRVRLNKACLDREEVNETVAIAIGIRENAAIEEN